MSDRELQRIFRFGTRDLDARQRARIRQLKGLERVLYEALSVRLVDSLERGGGVISTGTGSASINQLIDVVFNAIDRSGMVAFNAAVIADTLGIVGNADRYMGALRISETSIGDRRWKAIQANVDTTMRKRLGLTVTGKPIKGGYLDSVFKSPATRNAVKQTVNAAVTGGLPMSQTLRAVRLLVAGTKDSPGALLKQNSGLIFDTYQQVDRSTTKDYATRLGLNYYVYAGGLIETSREFCVERDGKVFTSEEVKEWRCDPKLPKEKKEGQCASNYDPLVDMGRWACRHRIRPISRGLAEQLRPELAEA